MFVLDGELNNVSLKKYNTQCKASSEYPAADPALNYTCENAQDPQWINDFEWVGYCSTCVNQYINLTFEKSYDIIEICLEHRREIYTFWIKKASIELSNQNVTVVELDQIDFQKCFLLRDNFGLDTKWLLVKILDSYTISSNGFESIMAYAYNGSNLFFAKEFLNEKFSFVFLMLR